MNDRRVAVWTLASTAVSALLQLLLMVVAARYMSLASFGLLAVINTVAAIILAFQEMGMSSYCIYAGEQSRREHATLYWVSLALAGFFAVGLLASIPLLVFFFRMPELPPYLYALAFNFFLVGMAAQFQANFIRVLRADVVAKIELFARVIAFILAVGLMVIGKDGVACIVAGMLAFSFARLLLLGALSEQHWRPALAFMPDVARKALRYGIYQGGSQLINQLRSRLDIIVISRLLGQEAVGLYSMAKDLLEYPLRVFQPLMGRLLLPRLARLRQQPEQLHGFYFRGLAYTAWGALAVYAPVVILGNWVVEIMYGSSHIAVAALLPCLLVYAVLRPLGINAGMLAQATGNTAREFVWNLFSSAIMIAGLAFAAVTVTQVSGFAIALSAIQLLVSVLVFPLFVRYFLDASMGAYLRAWGGVAVLACVLAWVSTQINLPPLAEVRSHLASLSGVVW